ncbi:Nn.00g117060.m01.CDS01 [Neocucurbitaria sp. VM-36]
MASQPPVFRLPRELRDQIIAYVFDDFEEPRVEFNHVAGEQEMAPPYNELPALCKASKQLYYEATLSFLSRITPVLCNIGTICWLRKWLVTFPSDSGFRAIRQLAFRNFDGPEQIKGYELIALCPNIRTLDIMFGDEYADPGTIPLLDIMFGDADPGTIPSSAIDSLISSVNAYESLDNIISMHQLYRLVQVPHLERLHFGFHDWEQPISIDRARQVMEWLRIEFQAKGKTVHIECWTPFTFINITRAALAHFSRATTTTQTSLATMSDSSFPPPPFLRIPRELRDQIYTYVFETAPINWLVPHVDEHFPKRISFPDSWTKRHSHDSGVIFHAFPALCCTSRQMFLESTPHFLTNADVFTLNTQSSKILYDWLTQFPDHEGFKAVKDFACYQWDAFDLEATQVQIDLLTRLTNVQALYLTFTFPSIVDGIAESEYDWEAEQHVYIDTGLLYPPKKYYTATPEIWDANPQHPLNKYPPPKEYIARETEALEQKLEQFIAAHRLQVLFDLPKLESLSLEFATDEQGSYRHKLCNPLYKWFEKEWEQRGRNVLITTGIEATNYWASSTPDHICPFPTSSVLPDHYVYNDLKDDEESDLMGNFFSSRVEDTEWKSDARYAMESGVFCVICGGPFDMEGDVYNIDPKEKRYRWLFNFRLLGSLSHVLKHRVTSEETELINVSESNDVFLSEPSWFSMTGSGYFRVGDDTFGGDTWFDALRDDPDADTLFPLHDVCIDLSRRVIENLYTRRIYAQRVSALAVLNNLLQSRFRSNAHAPFETRNDILDICTVLDKYGSRSVMALTKLEWWGGEYEKFYTDPLHVSDITSFSVRILKASPNRKQNRRCVPHTTRGPYGIERLPPELLDQICSYLPATSVITLHRVSKTLAQSVPLDNSFWRNSLLAGSLLPHIWDLDKAELGTPAYETSRDWKSVAQLLAKKQFPISGRDRRLEDIPNGLWNRCRIWSIMEEAVELYFSEMHSGRISNSSEDIR